jgi:hypothetical protein
MGEPGANTLKQPIHSDMLGGDASIKPREYGFDLS